MGSDASSALKLGLARHTSPPTLVSWLSAVTASLNALHYVPVIYRERQP